MNALGKWIAGILASIISAVAIAIIGRYLVGHGASPQKLVPVPNIIGASRDAAVAETNAVGLRVTFGEEPVADIQRAGSVTRQVPSAGERVDLGSQVTASLGSAEVNIDFTNRRVGSIHAKSFTEHGITFSIVGDTQSCGDAKLELQEHKLLGHYLAPTQAGDRGLSCSSLQIRVSFPAPVRQVTVTTADLGTGAQVHLSALDQDGNDLHWSAKPVESGAHAARLVLAAPSHNDLASGIYFYRDDDSILYSLALKR